MASSINWKPPEHLPYWFTPTRFDRYGEIRKADIKNHNLPILQYWYNGNPVIPLKCLISKRNAFTEFPDIGDTGYKLRFVLDFNHIRQKCSPGAQAGISIDKTTTPSSIIREAKLDHSEKKPQLIDMMTTIPLHSEYHRFVTQDSAKTDITLINFNYDWWPWGLKTQDNFNKFCGDMNLDLDYTKFIKTLSDINAAPVLVQWHNGLLHK